MTRSAIASMIAGTNGGLSCKLPHEGSKAAKEPLEPKGASTSA